MRPIQSSAEQYVKVVRPSALVVLGAAFWYFMKRPTTISPTWAPRQFVKTASDAETYALMYK